MTHLRPHLRTAEPDPTQGLAGLQAGALTPYAARGSLLSGPLIRLSSSMQPVKNLVDIRTTGVSRLQSATAQRSDFINEDNGSPQDPWEMSWNVRAAQADTKTKGRPSNQGLRSRPRTSFLREARCLGESCLCSDTRTTGADFTPMILTWGRTSPARY